MLKRISIKGFKSIEDLTVELKDLTVLFGPNAAGKSNFLDAIQILSRIATRQTLGEAFAPPYRGAPLESFSFPSEGIKGLLKRESASFSIEADLRLSQAVVDSVNRRIREMKRSTPDAENPPPEGKGGNQQSNGKGSRSHRSESFIHELELRYKIEVQILTRSGVLRVANEELVPLKRSGEPKASRNPFLSLNEQNRFSLRMEGQAHPIYHDRYMDRAVISLPLYPPHYPHMVAAREEMSRWFFYYLEPRERMRAPCSVKEVHHIGTMGEDLAAFLNTLRAQSPRQLEAISKALHLIIPTATEVTAEPNDLGEIDLSLVENGTSFPARLLSEGTLRTLGVLSLSGAKSSPALVAFEEPENGIHPKRIELIAERLKTMASEGCQVIVTTHSPLLPDWIPDENLLVCRRKKGRTHIESLNAAGPLFRKRAVESALEEEPPLVSERILRGDFDGDD